MQNRFQCDVDFMYYTTLHINMMRKKLHITRINLSLSFIKSQNSLFVFSLGSSEKRKRKY